jgi:hypothetical protein
VIRRRFKSAPPKSGGKTWRKKIGGTGVAVHSTVMVPVGRNIIVPPP